MDFIFLLSYFQSMLPTSMHMKHSIQSITLGFQIFLAITIDLRDSILLIHKARYVF